MWMNGRREMSREGRGKERIGQWMDSELAFSRNRAKVGLRKDRNPMVSRA